LLNDGRIWIREAQKLTDSTDPDPDWIRNTGRKTGSVERVGWGGEGGGIVCRFDGDSTAAALGRAGRNYHNPEVTQFKSRKLMGTGPYGCTRGKRLKLLVAHDILKRQPPYGSFFYELELISNKYLISCDSNWPKVVIICERLGDKMFTSGLSSVLTARAVGSSPPHDSAQSCQ
jgi:hypothetical protein